jgi:hypothetical protein
MRPTIAPANVAETRVATMSSSSSGEWPTRFRPVLAKLVAGGSRYFGSPSVAVQPVRELDRPFSTILQIRVAGDAGTDHAFVKILKPREDTPAQIESMRQNVVKDFEMTRSVHRGLASYPGLTAVRPIACFPEDLAIVTEQAPGATLADLLTRAAGWPSARAMNRLVGSVRQAGAWIRAVQTALPQDREVAPDSLRAYLDRRLNDLESAGPIQLTPQGRAAVERYHERLIEQALTEQGARTGLGAVWIHADFCPENVIVRDGRMTVLDFTMAKTGTTYHDVSHLYLRIDSMQAKPWFRPRTIARLNRELLDSFESGLTPDRPLFALTLLQHVLCHLLEIRSAMRQPVTRLYARRLDARHRRWLATTAGVNANSWVR